MALCLAGSAAFVFVAHGQGRGGGSWSQAGGDPQLSGFQKSEPRLTRDNIKNAKFLWKIKLGSADVAEPTEPLFAGHTITNAGFKDMVVVYGPDNTLTNVDYEQGIVLWQRHIAGEVAKPNAACANGQFSAAAVQPLPTFSLAAGRGAAGARGAAAAPAPPPPPPPADATHRVGGNLAGGVGFGGLRAIFVETADGNLHEQELNNGWDYAPPVEFMPAGANLGAPLIVGSTIYGTTGGCGGTANGAYALDMSTDAYHKVSFDTGSIAVTGTDGPALSTDEKTLFVTTGTGSGSGDAHAHSVVALDAKTMQMKDYYTQGREYTDVTADDKKNINVSPVVFDYKGHDMVAAYVEGGRLALLDGASLGGSDHHTPLAVTAPLAKDGGIGSWGRLASAEDSEGTRFVYVSVRGPLAVDAKLPTSNGAVTDGAIVAFKVEEQGGKFSLAPAWVSPNVENPSPASIIMNAARQPAGGFGGAAAQPAAAAPPVKAGGVVFTLSQGEPGKTHAKLYGFDAETGAQVFSSGDEVGASANEASISISGAHVLFVTSDNTLYAFGISYEKD